MKFHETLALKNLNLFQSVKRRRVNFELLLLFYVIKYFDSKSILEIGFGEGCSFGVMCEAASESSELTTVDIAHSRTIFDHIYSEYPLDCKERIKFLTMSSLDFVEDPGKYDFILVDGDHHMPTVYKDLVNVSKLIKSTGIIMIDDYDQEGPNIAIDQFLELNTGFVPFLIDDQGVYFHHISHCADQFLDVELEKIFASFGNLSNTTYKSFLVKKVSCPPVVSGNNDIFALICDRCDL
jgi:predicted O-methyltransferase YrrM